MADSFVGKNLSYFEDKPAGLISKLEQKLGITRAKLDLAAKLKKAIVVDESIVVAADRLSSELIKITMQNTDPKEAKQIVDAFITAYMDIEVVNSDKNENQQLQLLESQRDVLATQMEFDRQAMYQLGQEYGSIALESREDMQLQQYADLLSRLTTAQARRIELEAQVQFARTHKRASYIAGRTAPVETRAHKCRPGSSGAHADYLTV